MLETDKWYNLHFQLSRNVKAEYTVKFIGNEKFGGVWFSIFSYVNGDLMRIQTKKITNIEDSNYQGE